MGEVKVYDNTKDFWREVSPFLKKDEAKNSLLLGLAYRFRFNPVNCLYQSAFFEEGEMLGAVICSRRDDVQCFLPASIRSKDVARELYEKFYLEKM